MCRAVRDRVLRVPELRVGSRTEDRAFLFSNRVVENGAQGMFDVNDSCARQSATPPRYSQRILRGTRVRAYSSQGQDASVLRITSGVCDVTPLAQSQPKPSSARRTLTLPPETGGGDFSLGELYHRSVKKSDLENLRYGKRAILGPQRWHLG